MYTYRVGGWEQDRDRSEDVQKQYLMYQDRGYDNPCLSHSKPTMWSTIPLSLTCKSAWFPGCSRMCSVVRVATSHPVVEVSNMYTMLDERLKCM